MRISDWSSDVCSSDLRRLGLAGVGLVQVDLDHLALPHVADAGEAEGAQGMSDRPALGVQDAGLQGHVNNSLHRSSDGVPRRTPRPRLVVPGLVLPGLVRAGETTASPAGP